MPRRLEITISPGHTDALVADFRKIDGLLGLRLQRGASVAPPGDVVTLDLTSSGLHALMLRLKEQGIGATVGTSVRTSEAMSLLAPPNNEAIFRDDSEATWEEMESAIGKESNMTINGLILMALAGFLAAIGIATNALHIVIGAMVIAPGFEPLVRVAMGALVHGGAWRRGLADTGKGYAAIIVGAAVADLLLQSLGKPPLGGENTYLPAGVLISYWTTLSLPSLLVSAAAGCAGAVVVAANRSVLTAGVMIALALVPSATIAGMGLATGEWALAGRGMLRLLLEIGLVLLASLAIFAWKKRWVQNRRALA